MANGTQINELFQFNPGIIYDPVPPWVLNGLDREIIRELALITLERSKAIAEINLKTLDKATGILKNAKF
jgi:hypothetical protein